MQAPTAKRRAEERNRVHPHITAAVENQFRMLALAPLYGPPILRG
jgi:hypothetical protein